jgi:3-oxoacyl-[acyl-carrier protein] reductase
MDLVGKVAFVTGGSGDIGGAIATTLAGAGVDIVISYVSSAERASSIVDVVQGMGRRSLAVHLNQRDPVAIKTACDKAVAALNRIDILVNNAAWNIGIPFTDLDALTAEIWDQVLETNLRGPYLLARAFAPELRRHKTGRIINVASVAGIVPGGSSIAYASSKAGLIHLTRCLAVARQNRKCPGHRRASGHILPR